MTRYIQTRNAWGDDMKAESSIVPELLLPFERMKAKCREAGIEVLDGSHPDLPAHGYIFIDCPALDSPTLLDCLKNGIPFLLLICENLHLQPNKTYAEVGKHAAKILSYEVSPLYPEKTVRLRYPVDLENGLALRLKALQGERPYLLGMIAGLKQLSAVGDLYRKRAEWAFQLSEAVGDRFALWGPGWKEVGFKSAKGFLPPSLNAKHDALSQCEFALCLENNNSIPGYVTEKIFNALIAGCIPIYEGHKDTEITKGVFINAADFKHPLELLEYLETMTPDHKRYYRTWGDDFLNPPDDLTPQFLGALPFSQHQYITTLFEAIKGIL